MSIYIYLYVYKHWLRNWLLTMFLNSSQDKSFSKERHANRKCNRLHNPCNQYSTKSYNDHEVSRCVTQPKFVKKKNDISSSVHKN